MPQPAQPKVVAQDFPGLATSVDPRDLQDGAAEDQVNACCLTPGELQVRRGIKEVVFDSE